MFFRNVGIHLLNPDAPKLNTDLRESLITQTAPPSLHCLSCFSQFFCKAYKHVSAIRAGTKHKKLWEELISYLIRNEPYRKRPFQQFFYCCLCICCRGNVFIEPLPSNDRRDYIQTQRLIGGIYEVRR
jgi:hypothetical protein